MRTMYVQSLQKHPSDLLANVRLLLVIVVGSEEVENRVAEVVGMAVRIAELIRNSAEEVVASFRAELSCQFHQKMGLR